MALPRGGRLVGVLRQVTLVSLGGPRQRRRLSTDPSMGAFTPSAIPIAYPFREWKAQVESVRRNIQLRRSKADIDLVLGLYEERAVLEKAVLALRTKRHALARSHQQATGKTERRDLEALGSQIKLELSVREGKLAEVEAQLMEAASLVPNASHVSVPDIENEVISMHGTTEAPGPMRDHVELNKHLDLFDLSNGAKTTGSSFCFLKREAALLELALVQYALSLALKEGYTPILTPDLVRAPLIERSGFHPRSEDPYRSVYFITPSQYDETAHPEDARLALVGTSEIPLAAYHANERLTSSHLPLKYVALSHCFRREAGCEGRGLYRLHQFTKLELFVLSSPEEGLKALEEILKLQEAIFTGLGFTYRVLNMARPELGSSAHKKYDIEAWMPGRGEWGEVSSASHCTDYQSRRLNIRYTDGPKGSGAKWIFPTTLNGTAMAVPRALLTLLEMGQQTDGSIQVPNVLVPWMHGHTLIRPRS